MPTKTVFGSSILEVPTKMIQHDKLFNTLTKSGSIASVNKSKAIKIKPDTHIEHPVLINKDITTVNNEAKTEMKRIHLKLKKIINEYKTANDDSKKELEKDYRYWTKKWRQLTGQPYVLDIHGNSKTKKGTKRKGHNNTDIDVHKIH